MRALSLIAATALASSTLAGEISGTVRLAGPAPTTPPFYPETDLDACGSQTRPLQSLVLGTNHTVRDAVVYLGAPGFSSTKPGATAILDLRDCEFAPRVQIVRNGATLVLRNSDPVLHVVRLESLSGTNRSTLLLNTAMPYAGFEKTFTLPDFKEPALLKAAGENGHIWMSAYVAVMPHGWASLTDEAGRFTLSGVPAGAYKLYAWHEVLGTLVRDVKLNGGRATNIELQFASTARKQSD